MSPFDKKSDQCINAHLSASFPCAFTNKNDVRLHLSRCIEWIESIHGIHTGGKYMECIHRRHVQHTSMMHLRTWFAKLSKMWICWYLYRFMKLYASKKRSSIVPGLQHINWIQLLLFRDSSFALTEEDAILWEKRFWWSWWNQFCLKSSNVVFWICSFANSLHVCICGVGDMRRQP